MLGLLLVVAAVAVGQARSTAGGYDELIRRGDVLQGSQRMKLALEEQRNDQQGFLLTGDRAFLAELEADISNFRSALAEARASVRTATGGSLLDVVERRHQRLVVFYRERAPALAPGEPGAVAEFFAEEIRPRSLAVTVAIDRFIVRQEDRRDDYAARAVGRATAMQWVLLGLGVAALALGGTVAGGVLRAVDRRDRRLADSRETIAGLYAEQRHIADALQAGLLPRELPEAIGALRLAARYRPAGALEQVGGDSYDVIPLVRGGQLCLVCDVCGKGPEAAAVTALVRHTVRALADHDARPARLLERLHDQLLRQRGDSRFVTVALARIAPDPDSAEGAHTLTVALGGHPCPLVIRRDASVQPVGQPGSLVGGRRGAAFHERAERLEPGDAVVLFTDGVTEARRDREIWGTERLAAVLAGCAGAAPDAIADRVQEAVRAFERGAPRDDLALLVIGVAEGSPAAG